MTSETSEGYACWDHFEVVARQMGAWWTQSSFKMANFLIPLIARVKRVYQLSSRNI